MWDGVRRDVECVRTSAGSTGAPPADGGVVTTVTAPVSTHRAGDKTLVVASDGDKAPGSVGQVADGGQGSQLPALGDPWGAGTAEGGVVEAEPAPSEQSRKGLSNS